MLIEFRVENYRSFRDEQVLSLVAGKDDSLPSNCFSAGGFQLLRCAAVYGANASGKSNLIKAAKFMSGFVESSADRKVGDPTGADPFRFDAVAATKPSTFEATFITEGVRYQYGFEVSAERVVGEWLFAYPKGRAQRWFERRISPESAEDQWDFGSYLGGEKTRVASLTRPNALFLSVGAKFNHEQLTPVYRWFSDSLRVLDLGGSMEPLREFTAFVSAQGEGVHGAVAKMLRNADLGIRDFRIAKRAISEKDFPDDPNPRVRDSVVKLVTALNGSETSDVGMLHQGEGVGGNVWIDFDDESHGTQRLFSLAGPWLDTLAHGYSLFIDEFEASLHPLLARGLISLVQNPQANKRDAQVVFVTHNTGLLDAKLFRRDQVWFTEKDADGASHLYSLQDYKEHRARKGEALEKGYLAGRYGAIPILKDFGLE